MRFSLLSKDPGPAGCDALLAPRTVSTPLEGKLETGWLVIGAGFAGPGAAQGAIPALGLIWLTILRAKIAAAI